MESTPDLNVCLIEGCLPGEITGLGEDEGGHNLFELWKLLAAPHTSYFCLWQTPIRQKSGGICKKNKA